jgi:putative acetyltransferase
MLTVTDFRREKVDDEPAIRYVNEQAFGRPHEANLVDALRNHNACVLSMVALEKGLIVGHILFTPVTIDKTPLQSQALGLGPMAVLPAYQRRGIGSQLVRIGFDECRRQGHEIVVVVGHPEFYSRFGFTPAKPCGIECEFDVPNDAFMVLELRKDALVGKTGVAKYQGEFRDL